MIRISQNAERLARKNHWKASRVLQAMHEGNKQNARTLKQRAQIISSITDHSLDDLRRMGHPYAVRRPMPPHEAHMIHDQGGKFKAGWFATTQRRGGNSELRFGNRSDVFEFLEEGTRRMIKRGPMAWLIETYWELMQKNIRRHYRRILHAERGR